MSKNNANRKSGIELLKILVMFLIVTSHVIQSVGQISADYPVYNRNVVNLCEATDNIQLLTMAIVWNFVMFAVDVFFVSSFWFLADSHGINRNKVISIISNVWIVSVVFLAAYYVAGVQVSAKLIVKSLMPTTFSNNWFITCYLIMYLIHPFLNIVCDSIEKKTHKIIVIGGFFGYCMITYVSENLLFYSKILIFMILYMTVNYIKRYMTAKANDRGLNIRFLIGAFAVNVIIICMINMLGKHVGFMQDKLMHTNTIQNPFLIIMAITAFNLFRCMKYSNDIVNRIAGLTMYIYIIHENILFRTYTRPMIWDRLLSVFGYECILPCTICFSAALFLLAVLLSAAYSKILSCATFGHIYSILEKH